MAIRYLEDNPAPAKSRIRYIDEAPTPVKQKTPFSVAGPMSGDIEGMVEMAPAVGGAINPLLAGVGELGRQGYRQLTGTRNSKPRKLLGIGPEAPGIVNDVVGAVGGTYAGNKAFQAGAGALKAGGRALAPAARKLAVGIVERLIKPTGEHATEELGQRGSQIAENLLKERLVKGDKQNIAVNALNRTKRLQDQITGYLDEFANREVDPTKALSYADEEIAKQAGPGADIPSAEKLRGIKRNIIESHGLESPVYQDVEKGQFVMGGQGRPSTSVTASRQNVPLAGRAKRKILEAVQSGDVPEVNLQNKVTGLSSGQESMIDSPMTVKLQEMGKKQVQMTAPKITKSVSPEVKGVSKTERVQVGTKRNNIPVKKAQEYKKAQYQKVGESSFGELATPEKQLRKGVARGYKEGIEQAIPERPIGKTNERIGELADAIDVLSRRLGVSKRLNVASLGDLVLAGMASPQSLGLLTAKKTIGSDAFQTGLARKLYATGRQGLGKTKPIVRKLAMQAIGRSAFGQN